LISSIPSADQKAPGQEKEFTVVPITHTVESTAETVRSGFLDPAARPAATVAPGDTVSYPDTWTHWGNEATFGMSFADREPLRHRYPDGPYSMLGPVEVSGAEPGEAVVSSVLLIVDPAAPITIRTAAAITQILRRTGDTWRISRRTVAQYR
jgi:hypothetical protein